mmetsp:Transcript_23656/g.35920  ORF Transcript_23656/g.35920 Transcript_23656/m.35920 type:complete len:227 (+) Transcript_23656:242-922(+)
MSAQLVPSSSTHVISTSTRQSLGFGSITYSSSLRHGSPSSGSASAVIVVTVSSSIHASKMSSSNITRVSPNSSVLSPISPRKLTVSPFLVRSRTVTSIGLCPTFSSVYVYVIGERQFLSSQLSTCKLPKTSFKKRSSSESSSPEVIIVRLCFFKLSSSISQLIVFPKEETVKVSPTSTVSLNMTTKDPSETSEIQRIRLSSSDGPPLNSSQSSSCVFDDWSHPPPR